MKFLISLFLIFSCQSNPKHKDKDSNINSITVKKEEEKILLEKEYLAKAIKFMTQKKFNKAKKELNRCVKYYPKSKPCHWELGWSYYSIPNWEKTYFHWSLADTTKKGRTKFLNEAKQMHALEKNISKINYAPEIEFNNEELINISAFGDIMMGNSNGKNQLPPNEGKNLFKKIKKHLKPQYFKIGNLEGPICDNGRDLKCSEDQKKCYSFKTPTKYGKHLVNVLDVGTIANNHIMDFDHECYDETVATLTKNKVLFSDGFKHNAIATQKNKEIIVVSFYTHKFYDHDVLKPIQAKNIIKKLNKEDNIIIVTFHAGAEGHEAMRIPFKNEVFKDLQRGDVVKFSRSVIDGGADLVIGHGPHVVRAFEVYKNKFIAYSLGNFLTYGNFNLLGYKKHGLILDLNLKRNGDFVNGQIISTVQKNKILKEDKKNMSLKLIKVLTDLDFPNHKLQFSENGQFYLTN